MVPLTNRPGGMRAYKLIIRQRADRTPRTHEGYEWLYVLDGRMRLLLGEHDVVLGPFGPQGERMHVRARPKS